MPLSNSILWFSQATDHKVSGWFHSLGGIIYDKPIRFAVFPVLIAMACMSGFSQLEEEFNAENLYTPETAQAFEDRDLIEATFGFDPRPDVVYAVGIPEGVNILTSANLLSWLDQYEEIENFAEMRSGDAWPEDMGVPINLTTVCFKTNDLCTSKSILSFWDYNRTLIASRTDSQLRQDITDAGLRATEPSGIKTNLPEVASVDASGNILAFKMIFYLMNNQTPQDDGPDDDARTTEWELARFQATPSVRGDLRLYSFNEAARGEASDSISRDLQLLGVGYVLLLIYAVIVLSRGNSVHTHGSLAFASFAAIGLSVGACYGLGSYFGIPFSGVIQTLAFLLLGVGMDDTFVLVAAFQQPDVRDLPPKERVQKALSRAGVSITVTSMTDMIAFLVGSITDIPAVRAFCYYAAIGIAFDFFLQLTFFIVIMIQSAKREEKNKYDWLCCVVASNPEKNCCSKSTFDKEGEEPVTKFLRDVYAPKLLSPMGKAAVLLITAAYLGASGYFISELEVNFDRDWFIPESDPLTETIEIRDKYFGSTEVPTTIYTFTVDYTRPVAQSELASIAAALDTNEYYVPNSCRNWWPAYFAYVGNTNSSVITNGIVDPAEFYTYFDQFMIDPASEATRSLILMQTNPITNVSTIKGTEIPCRFRGVSDDSKTKTGHNIDSMDASRAIAARGANLGPARAYFIAYVFWEGLDVVYEQLLQNIILALCAVLIICIVLLGSVPAAFTVFLMLVMIDVEVLGSYYYWGEQINYVTGIFLVIAVGISVDSCAHITHTFLDSDGTGNERATKALTIIGRSVLNGGISTILVLLPLFQAESYVFQVYFVCFLSIIGHSLWHGFFVLPVLLSIIQPSSYESIRTKLSKAGWSSMKNKQAITPDDDLAAISSAKELDVISDGTSEDNKVGMKVITNI